MTGRTIALSMWVVTLPGMLQAQSTNGLISGMVRSRASEPVAGAVVLYCRLGPNGAPLQHGFARTNPQGYYALPFLTPGEYRLRAQKEDAGPFADSDCFPPPPDRPAFQAQEKHDLTLPVAGRLLVDFDLRPISDVWDSKFEIQTMQGTIVRYFGADGRDMKSLRVATGPAAEQSSGATLSYVLDSSAIANLPLNGRDLYSTLVVLPGVTSDTGTGRGLGLAVNGTRSTASNFLLDGLENNNYLTTGPLTVIAPEATQEYRISTNNFSAEFGRAAGFIANAVTRGGSNQWHGLLYTEVQNEVLNANTPENIRNDIPRRPLRQLEGGGQTGGPIVHDRVFASFAVDLFRSRNRLNPNTVAVPSNYWRSRLDPSSTIYGLLSKYPLQPGKVVTDPNAVNATLAVEQPVSIDRGFGLARIDANSKSGATKLMGRVSVSRTTQPDFLWSPYPGFSSEFNQPDVSTALNLTSLFQGARANEFRFGWSRDSTGWDRPHPEIPTFSIGDGTLLPGSQAAYGYRNVSRNIEINDSFQWVLGRHILRFGAGLLVRRIDTSLTYAQAGQLVFNNLLVNLYLLKTPNNIVFAVDRLGFQRPDYAREYGYGQAQAYVEDTIRVSRNLTISMGLRYENFGVPKTTGAVRNLIVQPGPVLQFALPPAGADQPLLKANNLDFAGRLGLSYAVDRAARTVLRGAYGIFYDRPFDNLWENLASNNYTAPSFPYLGAPDSYLSPPDLSKYAGLARTGGGFPYPLYIDPNWKVGYVHSYFAGIDHRLSEAWTATVYVAGSLGRHLATSDVMGRPLGTATYIYRAPEGGSSYNALSGVVRRQTHGGAVQASYTWSHSIDNQSDPLAGDFFDLAFKATPTRATFSLPGDSRIDRGNSDFDQRHNLVFYAYQEIPAVFKGVLWRGWTIASLGAVRSGLPFTVTTATSGQVYPGRPDLIAPDKVYQVSVQPADPNTRQLLNPAAFRNPASGTQGNLGRNSLRGPGFYSFDLSLGRTFALRRLGEAARITVRADAFNFLNHLNLGQPGSNLGDKTSFGVATYGRTGTPSNFPSLAPLDENPASLQLILRLSF